VGCVGFKPKIEVDSKAKFPKNRFFISFQPDNNNIDRNRSKRVVIHLGV